MRRLNPMLAIAGASLVMLSACNAGADASEENTASVDAEALPDGEVHAAADMHLVATTALREAMEDSFDEGQLAMLTNVAHQSVVAGHCDGFEIDQARFTEEMNRLHYNAEGEQIDVSENELDQLEKKALLGLGMAIGSQLVIAEMDLDAFCEVAREDRQRQTDGAHVIYADPVPTES